MHGGVRYLAAGDLGLVREALHERALLRRNAPHVVHDRAFVVPSYSWWAKPYYGLGLKLYDLLAGRESLGASRLIGRAEAINNLLERAANGGVTEHDWKPLFLFTLRRRLRLLRRRYRLERCNGLPFFMETI